MKKTVITIGREYGSGGRLIGIEVAKQLGIPYYDKEILNKVAKETGFAMEFLQDNEKKPTGSLIFDRYSAVASPTLSEQVFIAQSKIIRDLAEQGSCVLIGRSADYVLRDREDCLKVFIHAPLAERVKRADEVYGHKEHNLESFVTKQDKARASYYNYFTTSRWGSREAYDMCINSAIGVDQCVQAIVAAVKE